MDEHERRSVDGCAIFYRQSKYDKKKQSMNSIKYLVFFRFLDFV